MTEPRRLVLVLPSFAGGGAERVMLQIAAGVDRTKLSPYLIVLQDTGSLRALVPPDVPVTNLDKAKLRLAIPALAGALREQKPDIILSTMAYLNMGVALAVMFGVPGRPRLVLREANRVAATLDRVQPAWLGRLGYRLLYRRADAVICNAAGVRDELTALSIMADRISVIPNPIDEETLRVKAQAGTSWIGEAPPGGRAFVAAGRLMIQKGFDRLIDWFAAMPPEDRLIILGDGPLREGLDYQIKKMGLSDRIRLPGFVPDPWASFAQADALVMPSRWEGLPNTALEALALGTPVIATPESGGLIDLVEDIPPPTLTIAKAGKAFIDAMQAVTRRKPGGVVDGPILPARFNRDAVLRAYQAVLLGEAEDA